MRQTSRWHPCLLPDNYQRKLRQDLAETDAAADSASRLEAESEVERDYDDEDGKLANPS